MFVTLAFAGVADYFLNNTTSPHKLSYVNIILLKEGLRNLLLSVQCFTLETTFKFVSSTTHRLYGACNTSAESVYIGSYVNVALAVAFANALHDVGLILSRTAFFEGLLLHLASRH